MGFALKLLPRSRAAKIRERVLRCSEIALICTYLDRKPKDLSGTTVSVAMGRDRAAPTGIP